MYSWMNFPKYSRISHLDQEIEQIHTPEDFPSPLSKSLQDEEVYFC